MAESPRAIEGRECPSLFQVEGVLTRQSFNWLDRAKRASEKAWHAGRDRWVCWHQREFDHVGRVRLTRGLDISNWWRARGEVGRVKQELTWLKESNESSYPVALKLQACLQGEQKLFEGLARFYVHRALKKTLVVAFACLTWVATCFAYCAYLLPAIGATLYARALFIRDDNPCDSVSSAAEKLHYLTWETTLMVDYDSEYEESDVE